MEKYKVRGLKLIQMDQRMSGDSKMASPMVMAPTPMPTEEGMSGNLGTIYVMV